MRAALPLLVFLALAAPASAQTWSPPQSVAPGKPYVGPPGIAFSPDGRALASWSYSQGERSGVSVASRGPAEGMFRVAKVLVPSARTNTRVSGPFAYGKTGALAAIAGDRRVGVRFGHTDATFGKLRQVARGVRIGNASLAVNRSGAAALAWFDDRGTKTDRVYVALRRPHKGFGAPRRLATGRIRRVAVAIGASGDVLVVWNSLGKNLTRFKPRGRSSFRAIDRLRSKPAFFTDLRPVVTSNGRAAVAWSSQFASEGGESGPIHFQVAVRPSGADRFRRARLLEQLPPGIDDRTIDAVEASGRIAIAWSGTDGSNRRVKVAQFDGQLRFSPPQLISPAGEDAFVSDLAADDATGSMLAVWDAGLDAPTAIGAALADTPGASFGPPETATPSETARDGSAAFDPQTHQPTIAYVGRPGGGTDTPRTTTRQN